MRFELAITILFFQKLIFSTDLADATGSDERAVIRGLSSVGTVSGITSVSVNSSSAANDYEGLLIQSGASKTLEVGNYFRWSNPYVYAIVNDGTNVYQLRSHDLSSTGYGYWTATTDGTGAGKYFLDLLISIPGTATTYNYQTGQTAETAKGLRITLTTGTNPSAVLYLPDVITALNAVAPGKSTIKSTGTSFGNIGTNNWSASVKWYTAGFSTAAAGTESSVSDPAEVAICPTQASFIFFAKMAANANISSNSQLTFKSSPVTNLDEYVSGNVGSAVTFFRANSGDSITLTFNLDGFSPSGGGGPSTQIVSILNSIKRINNEFPIAAAATPTTASVMRTLLSSFNNTIYHSLHALLNNMLALSSPNLLRFTDSTNYYVGTFAGPGNAKEFRITTPISASTTALTVIGDWYDNDGIVGKKVGNQATFVCDLINISNGNFLSASNTAAPSLSTTDTDTIFPIGPSITKPAVFLFKDTTNEYAMALYAVNGISMGVQTIGLSGVVDAHATAIAATLLSDSIFATYNATKIGVAPNEGYIGCIKPVSLKYLATGSN